MAWPGFEEFAYDVGSTLHDIARSRKKVACTPSFSQNFHQAQGVRIVRSIVVGERNLLSGSEARQRTCARTIGPVGAIDW